MAKNAAGWRGWLAAVVGVLVIGLSAGPIRAQNQVWVQIEARPTLAEAVERARAYTAVFPAVAGFALDSGWYGIVLGPYARPDAAAALRDLRREGLIAGDSFLADGRNFGPRFWPEATAPAAVPPAVPEISVPPADPAAARSPQGFADETAEQIRASEQALTSADREEVQAALQWFGLYAAAIDGAFGSGTRAAMAAWQEANAAQPTGVLTTAQRAALVGEYRAAMAGIGLERVTEPEAGIEIDLPLAMVAFDRYAPPFVRYAPVGDSGVSVLLISQPGNQASLSALYDLLQDLKIVPQDTENTQENRRFGVVRRQGEVESYVYAELSGGLIRGFALVWPARESARMARVLDAMKASFRRVGDRALDPGLTPMSAAQRDGMLSGLEVRRPVRSRSGFFIDATGTVLTTIEGVQGCDSVTIDGTVPMSVALADPVTGLAVLTPDRPLAPPAIAAFQTAPVGIGAEVAVAGYPYEDRLSAPSLTYGFIEALEGLDGEADVTLLTLPALAGDAGGPVVDGTGAVVGMVLPRAQDAARQLPPEVAFAAGAASIAAWLAAQGLAPRSAPAQGALPPEDLTNGARAMTVLVSCWN